jgi:hypothetical protein
LRGKGIQRYGIISTLQCTSPTYMNRFMTIIDGLLHLPTLIILLYRGEGQTVEKDSHIEYTHKDLEIAKGMVSPAEALPSNGQKPPLDFEG